MEAIFQGKTYGAANVGSKGQLVIPAELRKELNINAGDQVMIFAKPDKKLISLMPSSDFSELMARAGKVIARLESQVPRKK
ncbi:MAG: AbrB/MazE/SpoVT family DNA-binding domain-containing protein [Candidatus Omnitrophica bacterium]|nr:AbrB/MazE/SpoVT family DNA-binding domain-containing protein [Candidatus Omnitrophota bacterium]